MNAKNIFPHHQVNLHCHSYNLDRLLAKARLSLSKKPFGLQTTLSARHARQVVFHMAEVAVPRALFRTILQAIKHLRQPAEASG